MSSPWVGRLPAGWQFRQRGLSITLPASANSARERSVRSAIEAKAGGPRRPGALVGVDGAATARAAAPATMQTTNDPTSRAVRIRWLPTKIERRAYCGLAFLT